MTTPFPDATATLPARSLDKRRSILDAASRAFLAHGYGATSMDQVAQDAGVSKRTIYHHFGSKEGLFSALIAMRCERIDAELDRAENGGRLDVEAALMEMGHRFMGLILSEEGQSMDRILTAEAVRFPQLGEIFFEAGPENLTNRIAAFLETRAARGEIAIDDSYRAAACFLMMIQGKVVKCAMMCPDRVGGPDEIRQAVEYGVRLFLNGVRPRD
ncbi:MAG: TetR/AcrR family transcriptional regulator [Rhodobacterales bacterium]|nr:TetR/AcrR family transcriptional regulator [Rhodobacterales bacterium]